MPGGHGNVIAGGHEVSGDVRADPGGAARHDRLHDATPRLVRGREAGSSRLARTRKISPPNRPTGSAYWNPSTSNASEAGWDAAATIRPKIASGRLMRSNSSGTATPATSRPKNATKPGPPVMNDR